MVAARTDIDLARRDIVQQLEALPLSRAHLKTMLLAGLGPLFEAFDQQNIVYVLPALLAPFALSAAQAGLIAGSGLYGMALGCLVAGPLADRLVSWLATGACALLDVYRAGQGFSFQSTLTFGSISTLVSVPGYWASA